MQHTQKTSTSPRLVLGFDIAREISDETLLDLVKISDPAALILYSKQNDETHLQKRAELFVKPIQAQGVALLVGAEMRIGMRIGADGVHVQDNQTTIQLLKNNPSVMIGHGNIRDRHQAMEIGESGVDYLMFGKLGADNRPHPHPRNVRLSSWWASMMEVPCLVQAGTDINMLPELIETGAEFIIVEEMVFGQDDPHSILHQINDCLDKAAILGQDDMQKN